MPDSDAQDRQFHDRNLDPTLLAFRWALCLICHRLLALLAAKLAQLLVYHRLLTLLVAKLAQLLVYHRRQDLWTSIPA